MKKQLQKAIELAAYTGDKMIVVDEKTDTGMVVMNLEDYEELLFGQNLEREEIGNLTEEELLDKINSEITLWKSANEIEDEDGGKAFVEGDFLDSKNDDEKNAGIDEDISNEPEKEEKIEEELIKEKEEKVSEDENLYYYEEAPATPISREEKKGFTSVGDELKNRHNWEIPKEVKTGADEVK